MGLRLCCTVRITWFQSPTKTSKEAHVPWRPSRSSSADQLWGEKKSGIPFRGAFPISAPSMTKSLQVYAQDADEQTHYTMHSFRSEGSNSTGTRRVRCIYHYDAGLLEALSDSVEVHAPYGSGGARSHRQCHDYGGVSIIEEGNKRVPSERAEP